ncbi:MAG TPA: glycosyltransferase [Lentisphaeria bacterium]|nr:MAG: hypothetical protein A2X47_09115 [Lentisphaerae bacterium GWF2_38_69]HBM15441.1 glycosyltransferase [Lentisphaeria bacterium]
MVDVATFQNNNKKNFLISITIVTVSFNAVKTIEQTILSVINQTYSNFEYIIIDGGSVDGTLDIIKKHAHNISYWTSEPDKGIYDAMNKGVVAAKGDYIIFLGADDTLTESCVIEKAASEIANNSFPDIWCGSVRVIDKSLNLCKEYYPMYNNKVELSKMALFHQSVFAKKNLLLEHKFDASLQIVADYEFFCWCAFNKRSISTGNLCIANFSMGGVSVTRVIKAFYERQKVLRRYAPNSNQVSVFLNLVKCYCQFFLKSILLKCRLLHQIRLLSGWKR